MLEVRSWKFEFGALGIGGWSLEFRVESVPYLLKFEVWTLEVESRKLEFRALGIEDRSLDFWNRICVGSG